MASSSRDKPLRILVANRGEIALRLQHAILVLGHVPFGIFSETEGPNAPHLIHLPADQRCALPGSGSAAYLDVKSILASAKHCRIDAVAPGYGFLSESSAFAAKVEEAGLIWIGPRPDTLHLFGDKHRSKEFAKQCGAPVLPSTSAAANADELRAFATSLPTGSKLILKALAGGGGRGIRHVHDLSKLDELLASCKREAKSSFGDDAVFGEPFLVGARHIEVQVLGDGQGGVAHLGERECSLQRRHQKIIEICPSPSLRNAALRADIIAAANEIASAARLRSLATIEFLVVNAETAESDSAFYFLECNPRIQVEHTITEEAYGGFDLAAAQIRLALGASLQSLNIPDTPTRTAIQLRLCAERFMPDGNIIGTTGTLRAFSLPLGAGIRVDTAAFAPLPSGSYKQTLDFDSLLAKIIVTGPDYPSAVLRAGHALRQLHTEGVQTNQNLLLALVEHPGVRGNNGIHTRFIEENAVSLHETSSRYEAEKSPSTQDQSQEDVTQDDSAAELVAPEGHLYVRSHLPGRVVEISHGLTVASHVSQGSVVAVIESMKMEHTVVSDPTGTVRKILAKQGDSVQEGDAILLLELDNRSHSDGDVPSNSPQQSTVDLDSRTPLLEELDDVRKQARDEHPVKQRSVDRRHQRGRRTARENLKDLLDDDAYFLEYGDLAVAAQRTRLDPDDLAATRGDGVVVGWGSINSRLFKTDKIAQRARCGIAMYDPATLAGTQGYFHHLKLDRIFRSVLENPAPVVLYGEGGGGRPGDVDLMNIKVAGIDTPSFALLASIAARGMGVIAVTSGYCFAGNAALLGTADVVIATKGSSIGMGGPAMIEGGGLGRFKPQEVGPVETHHLLNGNVDVLVEDEAAATQLTKRLVSFFQGRIESAPREAQDQRLLRHIIPSSSKRAYDVRQVLDILSDDGFLEIGAHWGKSLLCGFVRIEGRPLGVVASSVGSSDIGGAIDASAAKKATRFVDMLSRTQCAHLLAVCDTPGFLVGPQAEKDPLGGLRTFPSYFAACSSFVERGGGRIFGLTLRRGVGLGAQAVLGGSAINNFSSVAWPSANFQAMGVEGAVRLGFAKQLATCENEQERRDMEASLIAEMEARGKALRMAEVGEIDSVIDPAETRAWLVGCLNAVEERLAVVEQPRLKQSGGRISRL